MCRSPRRSHSSTSSGSDALRAPPRAPRAPRAARAGSTAARAARRPPPRSRSAAPRRVSSSSIPYSETCRPRRTAASRSCTLWALEPVKCCRTLPNCSGATTLQVDLHPRVRDDPARRLRPRWTRLHELELGERARPAPPRSAAVAMMSMSFPRVGPAPARGAGELDRAGPAGARAARRRSARRPAARGAGCAPRAPRLLVRSSALSRFSSTFGAEARGSRGCRRLGRLAQRRQRVDAELVVEQPARLAPSPGRRMIAIRPAGNFARSFTGGRDRRPSRPAP